MFCSLGGSLICCDGCCNATHTKCARLGTQAIPDEWYCCDCQAVSSDAQAPLQSAAPKGVKIEHCTKGESTYPQQGLAPSRFQWGSCDKPGLV